MDARRPPALFTWRRVALSTAATLLVAGVTAQLVFDSHGAHAMGAQTGVMDNTSMAPSNPPGPLKDPVSVQADFVSTLAGKLGVSTDKLRSAIEATAHQLGAPVLLEVLPAPAGANLMVAAPYLDTLSAILGIDSQTLAQEWADHSLTDIARAHHIAVDSVASALKSARAAELDQAVRDGKISGDLAQTMHAHLDAEVDMLMNTPRPALPGVRPQTQ